MTSGDKALVWIIGILFAAVVVWHALDAAVEIVGHPETPTMGSGE